MPAMLLRLLLLPAMLLAQTGRAAPLTILAEERPPFVFLNAIDRPAGMAVEIVEAIQQRTGDIAPMQVHSWDSAIAIMDSQPHHMMFTLGATEDHRHRYVQLGPIMIARIQAYALPAQAAQLAALPEARLLREPAVASAGSMAAAAAQDAGMKLYPTRDGEQGLRLLLANRARLWVEANTAVATQLRFLGQEANAVSSVRTLSSLPLYLTFSTGTPADTIARWQQALQSMLQDGSYREIQQRWLPYEAPLPPIHLLQPGEAVPDTQPASPEAAASPASTPALPPATAAGAP